MRKRKFWILMVISGFCILWLSCGDDNLTCESDSLEKRNATFTVLYRSQMDSVLDSYCDSMRSGGIDTLMSWNILYLTHNSCGIVSWKKNGIDSIRCFQYLYNAAVQKHQLTVTFAKENSFSLFDDFFSEETTDTLPEIPSQNVMSSHDALNAVVVVCGGNTTSLLLPATSLQFYKNDFVYSKLPQVKLLLDIQEAYNLNRSVGMMEV